MSPGRPDPTLEDLVGRAWDQHRQAQSQSWLVRPSAPVLYFGDMDGYRDSPLRVSTVALNPSNREFPEAQPLARFPRADLGATEYVASLNRYFLGAPYMGWFDSFDRTLAGLQCSYRPTHSNVGLHTDIGSCLPTSPTWTGLPSGIRDVLATQGVPLWHDLATYLRPQILICSIKREWLRLIHFNALSEWRQVGLFDRTEAGDARAQPIPVTVRWYEIADEPTLVAFVRAAQKPLGLLSNPQKSIAGQWILKAWHDGLE
jgi:hypothetical protein